MFRTEIWETAGITGYCRDLTTQEISELNPDSYYLRRDFISRKEWIVKYPSVLSVRSVSGDEYTG